MNAMAWIAIAAIIIPNAIKAYELYLAQKKRAKAKAGKTKPALKTQTGTAHDRTVRWLIMVTIAAFAGAVLAGLWGFVIIIINPPSPRWAILFAVIYTWLVIHGSLMLRSQWRQLKH